MSRRTKAQAEADRRATDLSARLGRSLRAARERVGATQAVAAAAAGLSQPTWSRLELGGDARVTLATWNRAASAVGAGFDAHLPGTTSAHQPRDARHLRAQELVIRTAVAGGWRAVPEHRLDLAGGGRRFGDVVLMRATEWALVEIWDWFEDVGGALRDWERGLEGVEKLAIARIRTHDLPRIGGTWVVRATRRNRDLVADHPELFRSRFPASGPAWLKALAGPSPMPAAPSMLWISVDGERLFPARLRAAII